MVVGPHRGDANPIGRPYRFCGNICPRPIYIPTVLMEFLKKLWKGWKAFAHAVGKVQTLLLLTLFYLLILGPVSFLFRLFGKSALSYRAQTPDTYWRMKPVSNRGQEQYFQQF